MINGLWAIDPAALPDLMERRRLFAQRQAERARAGLDALPPRPPAGTPAPAPRRPAAPAAGRPVPIPWPAAPPSPKPAPKPAPKRATKAPPSLDELRATVARQRRAIDEILADRPRASPTPTAPARAHDREELARRMGLLRYSSACVVEANGARLVLGAYRAETADDRRRRESESAFDEAYRRGKNAPPPRRDFEPDEPLPFPFGLPDLESRRADLVARHGEARGNALANMLAEPGRKVTSTDRRLTLA